MKFIIISIIFLFTSLADFAQNDHCGSSYLKTIASKTTDAQTTYGSNYQNKATNNLSSNKYYSQSADTIPMIIHIVLDATTIGYMGGISGIIERVDSQINVLNRDFNAELDTSLIPKPFRNSLGICNIHFALAHTSPSGKATEGLEIIQTDSSGFEMSSNSGSGYAYSSAKYTQTGGADAWSTDMYLNIWVINTLEAGKQSQTIAVTIPPSYTNTGLILDCEKGIVINYEAFGYATATNRFFYFNRKKGRSLTHEIGHYFELHHTWGDDDGKCPGSGGEDDGISDTPPQAGPTYVCQNFPVYDICSPSSSANGIMFMNFMDYTDDSCRYMFTAQQARVIKTCTMPGYESYSLTMHPEILKYPNPNSYESNTFQIYPNPSKGVFNIYLKDPSAVESIEIVDMLGRILQKEQTKKNQNIYSFDVSAKNEHFLIARLMKPGGNISMKMLTIL